MGNPKSLDDTLAGFKTSREKTYFLKSFYLDSLPDFSSGVMGFNVIPEKQAERWAGYLPFGEQLRGMLAKDTGQDFRMVQMPRESYKSSFYTVAFASWALMNNPDLAILITSAAAGISKTWLSSIQKRIMSDYFMALYGKQFVRDEWRDSEILIKDRKQPRAEPSISTAGLDSTITSKHYDIIICDDLVNQDDRDSVAKRRASIKYIDDLVDLLDKRHGFCLFVGTPWHWEDAYQYIEKTLNPKLKSKVQREVVIHKEPIYEDTPKGRVYNFPEIFPPKKVEEIRNMKSDAANFAANYLLKPIHPDSQIFKFENFQFFNYGRDIGKVREVWCHIDPAGSGVQGDYTAMVLLGKRLDDNRVLILEAWIDQLRPSDREERVYVLWQFYAALKWADPAEGGKKKDIEQHWQVETVANQDEVRRSLVDFMVEKKKVADFPLSGKSRVANKTAKITNLELPVTNGTLLFRDDWETAPNGYRILIDQLLNFPLGHDDGPDALKEAFDLTQKNDVFVASL